jgi:hypothetical protein
MKSLITLTAAAALIAGISIASAQNAPTTTPNASPNAINKSSLPNVKSGNEKMSTAKKGSKDATKKVDNNAKGTTSGANPSSK